MPENNRTFCWSKQEKSLMVGADENKVVVSGKEKGFVYGASVSECRWRRCCRKAGKSCGYDQITCEYVEFIS